MALLNGVGGSCTLNGGAALANLIKWSVDISENGPKYVTSSTAGWSRTTVGSKEWTGQLVLGLDAGAFPGAPVIIGTLLTAITFGIVAGKTMSSALGARIKKIGGIEANLDGSNIVAITVDVDGEGEIVGAT
jgi:hypothetical protein